MLRSVLSLSVSRVGATVQPWVWVLENSMGIQCYGTHRHAAHTTLRSHSSRSPTSNEAVHKPSNAAPRGHLLQSTPLPPLPHTCTESALLPLQLRRTNTAASGGPFLRGVLDYCSSCIALCRSATASTVTLRSWSHPRCLSSSRPRRCEVLPLRSCSRREAVALRLAWCSRRRPWRLPSCWSALPWPSCT